jgi:Ca-activated chloride channel family protein
MRRCSNFLQIVVLLGLCGPIASAYGQAAPATQPPATGSAHVSPTVRETQPSLEVDRDPIVSPDAVDNLPVSPGHPNPGQVIHRNNGVYTLRRNVDEVVLNCTVVDSHGHLVNDLTQNDFHVFEDDAPQTIVSFQHSDLPVSIGILVDNSGSMRDKRSAVITAALDLVRASNPDDEAFVVNFSDEAFLDQDFTSSIAKLEQGLSHVQSAGGTALYDAVVAAANHLAEGARHPKQVLVIITDGDDDASGTSLVEAIHRVQDLQGPVVYSIGLLFGKDNTAHEVNTARSALNNLSANTGGLAFFPRSLSDVDSVAAEVARDIRNQYTIGYHSTIPMSLGGYRTVRVEARAQHHGKLFVRTKPGYYPQERSRPKRAAVKSAKRDIGNPIQ